MQEENRQQDISKLPLIQSRKHVEPRGCVEHQGAAQQVDGEYPIEQLLQAISPFCKLHCNAAERTQRLVQGLCYSHSLPKKNSFYVNITCSRKLVKPECPFF